MSAISRGVVSALVASLLAGAAAIAAADESDERLYGTWRTVEYTLGGRAVPLRGLMIITPRYIVGNTIFDEDGDGTPEANANAGSIEVAGGVIRILQWMQLHWRPNEPQAHFLREDVIEEIPYAIEGGRLIFRFPSGNRYVSERLE
jgi:hypothetical protein